MSRHPYIKIFRNPLLLAEMLELSSTGIKPGALAIRFGCTRRAIIYRCRVASGYIVPKAKKVKAGDAPYKYKEIIEENRRNKGHRYKEYIKFLKDQAAIEDEYMKEILTQLIKDDEDIQLLGK